MCRLRANFSRLAYPMQDTHIRERKVLRSLFLIAFLSSVLGLAFSSVFHRPILEEGRIEKWNSLMFPHSPVILLTADMEDGRLEIGFIISWGLFIPLILISFEVRFFYPLEIKNFRKFLWPILKAPPKGLWKNDLRFFTAPFVYINFHGNWPNDSLLPASTSFRP